MKIRSISCDHVAPDLKTFDLILMHGLHATSHVIEFLEHSNWSHSGMIIRSEDIGINDPDHPVLIWESTRQRTVPDEVLKQGKRGPMLVDFNDRIAANIKDHTHSLIAVRYMDVERTEEMLEKLRATVEDVHLTDFPSYTKVFSDVIKSKVLGQQIPESENFFCSELVAYTLSKVGLLPDDFDPSGTDPKDFSSKGYLPVLKRAILGPEVFVQP